MKTKFLALFLALIVAAPAFSYTIGSVNYKEVVLNYSKAKTAQTELESKELELQRYLLDQEKEYKKLTSPTQQKAFENQTAKALAAKQDAYQKLKIKKEKEIDAAIVAAIKTVAAENKVDSVVDARVLFMGGVDLTQQVIKKLNVSK